MCLYLVDTSNLESLRSKMLVSDFHVHVLGEHYFKMSSLLCDSIFGNNFSSSCFSSSLIMRVHVSILKTSEKISLCAHL